MSRCNVGPLKISQRTSIIKPISKIITAPKLCDDVFVVGFCVSFNCYRKVFKTASLLIGSQV